MNLTEKVDEMFLKYCYGGRRTDDNTHILIDFSTLKSTDDEEINKICEEIGRFSQQIIDKMLLIDSNRSQNGLPRREYKNNPGGGPRVDSTHRSLHYVCHQGDDELTLPPQTSTSSSKEHKCQKVHVTQNGPKVLITQLHHIVSEFGLLLPLGIFNITDQRLTKTGLDKTNPVITHPLEHKLSESEKVSMGTLYNTQITPENIRGLTPSEYKEEARKVLSEKTMIDSLGGKIHQTEFTQDSINSMVNKINTVRQLRLIDLRICNLLKDPPVKNNDVHIELYDAFLKEVIPLMERRISNQNILIQRRSTAPPIIIPNLFEYDAL